MPRPAERPDAAVDAFEETSTGSGVSTWMIDGQTHDDIGPGDAVCIPRGSIHGFANLGTSDATFLAVATPGVFGPAYFREIGEVFAAAQGGPPDAAAIGEVIGAPRPHAGAGGRDLTGADPPGR